ncbi:MAG: hypothetical protein RRA39_09980, partial [Cyanobacteriota bacterium PSP.bin.10]|nr:hypothetical protein [Cyanobacteriota bacterium PSP.bin.10]
MTYPPPPSPWPLVGVGAGAAGIIGGTMYWRRQRRCRQLQNQIQALQAPVVAADTFTLNAAEHYCSTVKRS